METVRTTNLDVASYLLTKGALLKEIGKKQNGKTFWFAFEIDPTMHKIARFWENDNIPGFTFVEHRRMLQKRIFNWEE